MADSDQAIPHSRHLAVGDPPQSLVAAARAIVAAPDPLEKVRLAHVAAEAWFSRALSIGRPSIDDPMPERPGRPERPKLLPPREMPARSTQGERGRFALLHSLAHIELNAIDMTWDLVGRFQPGDLPRAYYDDWVQVGLEEARHFKMLSTRLGELEGAYGDLPAHDGLWQAAQATGSDLLARIAVVPLVLEARGLDVSPAMIDRLRASGDLASAAVIEVIYSDEKRHVSFGAKWFRFLCDRQRLAPEPTFHKLVRTYFRGPVKPPFNDKARSEAGLTPGFYRPLVIVGAID